MTKLQQFEVTIKLRIVILAGGQITEDSVNTDALNTAHQILQQLHANRHFGRAAAVEDVKTVERT